MILLVGLIASAVAGAPPQDRSAQAPPSMAIRSETPVPFDLHHNKIMFDVLIEGREATAMLDSGATFTALDAGFAKAAGLELGNSAAVGAAVGRVTAHKLPSVEFEIAGHLKGRMPMAAIDLSRASAVLGRKLDVIVGGELLRKSAVLVDFSTQTLRFLRPGWRPPGFTALIVRLDRHYPLVDVQVGDETLVALLDLGSNGEIMVSPEAWSRIKPAGIRMSDGASSAVNGQIIVEGKATLPELRLAGLTEKQVEVRVGTTPRHISPKADALIGLGLLARYDMMLDIASGRLWLRPRANPPLRLVDRSGLGLMPDGPGFKVMHVSKGSPAELAGWKAGERICEVNGAPIDPRQEAAVRWKNGSEGTVVALGLCDGETRWLTLNSYY